MRSAIIGSGGDTAVLSDAGEKFCSGGTKARYNDRESVSRALQTASRLAAYSFNKAHAASYGLLAFFSAYAKVHFLMSLAAPC